MKVLSLIGQVIIALFLFVLSLGMFLDKQLVSGVLFLISALSVSPLGSMLLMKVGVYRAKDKVLIKAAATLIPFVIALFFFKVPEKSLMAKAKPSHHKTESVKDVPLPNTGKLKDFQNNWADSVVKSWEGSYIKGYRLSPALDTIYFQLNKEATKGKWKSGAEVNEKINQQDYDSLVALHFGNEFATIKTVNVLVPNAEQEKENIVKAERQQLINRQFSGWDGSNVYLERYIKQNMNDPKSYDHIQTTYSDKGSYILVHTSFRGKNAFGAKVINTVTAKMDVEGNVLAIISQN